MKIRILSGLSGKLILLHQVNKCRLYFKIIFFNRWIHNNNVWLTWRWDCILSESVFFSHIVIIICVSSSFTEEPFNLRNEFSKTFGSSHSRIKNSKSWRKKKSFFFFSLTIIKKKLIKWPNSPATAPKPWCSKSTSARFTEVVKRVSFRQAVMNSINFQQWLEKSLIWKSLDFYLNY